MPDFFSLAVSYQIQWPAAGALGNSCQLAAREFFESCVQAGDVADPELRQLPRWDLTFGLLVGPGLSLTVNSQSEQNQEQ